MKIASILLALPISSFAHFGINYPTWRADSLAETNQSISQWIYPCANVQPMQNISLRRTPWPLTGGSISLDLHHKWTYLFVNLGFGSYATNFNVSLNPGGGMLVNETGNGTFCWNHVQLPDPQTLGITVREGMEASIQVVTVGDSGSALYNCADIVFTSNATLLPAQECFNSTGVTAAALSGSAQAANTSSGVSGSRNATSSGVASSSSGRNATCCISILGLVILFFSGLAVL